MTLSHTILWSRRSRLIPPFLDYWPEYTVFSGADVRIAGVSLCALADSIGTPCVRTAAAVVPGTGGRSSETEFASVVITRVRERTLGEGGRVEVRVDADLDGCRPIITESHLTGRVSGARAATVALYSPEADRPAGEAVKLPGDIRSGDLLVIPCLGATALFDVRAR